MGKIATQGEAADILSSGVDDPNKCCTKQMAINLGCAVNGSYADNQLVQYEDLSEAIQENVIQMQYWAWDISVSFVATYNTYTDINYQLKATLYRTDTSTYPTYTMQGIFPKGTKSLPVNVEPQSPGDFIVSKLEMISFSPKQDQKYRYSFIAVYEP